MKRKGVRNVVRKVSGKIIGVDARLHSRLADARDQQPIVGVDGYPIEGSRFPHEARRIPRVDELRGPHTRRHGGRRPVDAKLLTRVGVEKTKGGAADVQGGGLK
jgi:hypothetical protein